MNIGTILVIVIAIAILLKTHSLGKVVKFLISVALWPILLGFVGLIFLGGAGAAIGVFAGIIISLVLGVKKNNL